MSWKNTSEEVRGKERSTNTDSHIPSFPLFQLFEEKKNLCLGRSREKIPWNQLAAGHKNREFKNSFLFLFRSADQKKWEEMGFIHFRLLLLLLLLLRGIPIFPFFFSLLLWAGPTTSSSSHYITNPVIKGGIRQSKKDGEGPKRSGLEFRRSKWIKSVRGGNVATKRCDSASKSFVSVPNAPTYTPVTFENWKTISFLFSPACYQHHLFPYPNSSKKNIVSVGNLDAVSRNLWESASLL